MFGNHWVFTHFGGHASRKCLKTGWFPTHLQTVFCKCTETIEFLNILADILQGNV